MIIDVDKISTNKFNEVKEKLDHDNKIFMYFVSPSGNGYKVVYRFAEAITNPNHYNDNYLHYAEMFEEEYDVDTDSSTQDVSHACFFSFDPNLYLNEDADKLEVIEAKEVIKLPKKKKSKKSKGSKSKTNGNGKKQKQKKIHLSTAVRPQEEGLRHWSLITAVGHFIAMGMDDKTIISLALALNKQNNPPKTEKEITKIVKKLIEKSEHIEGDFWTISRANIKIHTGRFIDFLSNKGFAKVYYDKSYIYVKIDGKIADEVIIPTLKIMCSNTLTPLMEIRLITKNRLEKFFLIRLINILRIVY